MEVGDGGEERVKRMWKKAFLIFALFLLKKNK